MNDEVKRKYGDIIHLPHHRSPTRPKMSNYDRAAQFSPFAALTGHADAIKETARLTDEFNEPTEERKAEMNEKIVFLSGDMKNKPEVTVTYFKMDEKKSGGAYITVTGQIKKIKVYERQIFMTTGEIIPMDMLIEIKGDCFEEKV